MTVKELIELLQHYPPETPIYTEYEGVSLELTLGRISTEPPKIRNGVVLKPFRLEIDAEDY